MKAAYFDAGPNLNVEGDKVTVYLRLRESMASPTTSMDDVAEILSLDPVLAARILRMAGEGDVGLSAPAAVTLVFVRARSWRSIFCCAMWRSRSWPR